MPLFLLAASKVTWKTDCGYNPWCKRGCSLLSLIRSWAEVLTAHTLNLIAILSDQIPLWIRPQWKKFKSIRGKPIEYTTVGILFFSSQMLFHYALYIPFYWLSGNMHSLKMCLIICWEQMQKSYTQELTETRFCTHTSSCTRNLPELWQSSQGTEITQMNVTNQN